MANPTRRDFDSEPKDANRDPLSGAPGAHPVGTGLGAASAGAAGAAVGAVAGPVGAVIGAAAGAVLGGLAGKAVAEQIDPTAEEAYWYDNFAQRPYASNSSYDDYRPAYQYGWEARDRYRDREFDDVESDLAAGWERAKGKSQLTWDKAKFAVRDAWDRLTGDRPRNDTHPGRPR